MVAADARTAITFSLSPGHRHDAPEGRQLLRTLEPVESTVCMIMDRAYEGAETRQLVLKLGFTPVVPPKGADRSVLARGSTTESCTAVAMK